jgi:hypothetical protein
VRTVGGLCGLREPIRNVLDQLARLLSQEEVVQGVELRKMLGKPLRTLYQRHPIVMETNMYFSELVAPSDRTECWKFV